MEYFATSLQHIMAEMERVDLLIRIQVWRAQQLQSIDNKFQGFYISEQEVESQLARPIGMPQWAAEPLPLAQTEVQDALKQLTVRTFQYKKESARRSITLRLDEIVRLFQLTQFDIDVLLICLAPELDPRYERLYAYLQDDVTKKRPSVDLVLNLLSPSFEAKIAARLHFAENSPLFSDQLLRLFDDPAHHQPSLLNKFLKVDERIINFLLGFEDMDPFLLPYGKYLAPQTHLRDLLLATDFKRRLGLLTQRLKADEKWPILYFQGQYGLGKQATAEAMCSTLGIGLLVINGQKLLEVKDKRFATAVTLVLREARLSNAALYWRGFDALLDDSRREQRETLLKSLENWPGLTFLAGNKTWEPTNILSDQPFVRIEFPALTFAERKQWWAHSLNGHTMLNKSVNVEEMANKFRFSGGQIRDTAVTAANLALWRDPEEGQVNMGDLYAASRLQSNRNLGTLAQKITPHYAWDDIVLPPDRIEQLREICNQVKYKAKVYEEWGFNSKLSLGKGVVALFAGPSGTGKTMAAEIIAGELELELYKIDLSTVVSKYIGETEKNLSRIFDEAETSNAILFFDEADALFGKRTEVRDSHDRHANIEISYLLQRMEEYEGVVIMTTNLRKNMDDAFMRRMHFAVEFPFPNESYRHRIWQQIWPEKTPRQADIDLNFMARRFEITGGNIRNIAVASAFLAADDGQVISMLHLIRATQREYQKLGRMVNESEFGEYAGQIRHR